MKIGNVYSVDPPKKLEKRSVEEIRQKKAEGSDANAAPATSKPVSGSDLIDQVEISREAKQLQRTSDEVGLSKELLSKLPSTRAHVVYEAIAKIKAGLYSSEEIAEEAATKLIQSGELGELI